MKLTVVPISAALLVLAACGGTTPTAKAPDSSSPTSSPPSAAAGTPTSTPTAPAESPTKALRVAVQAYSDAYLTGDADTAYGLLTRRCKDRMGKAEFADIVAQAKAQYGTALPMQSFDAQISGDLARVTYTYAVAEINQKAEPWAREGGRWREDDC